MDSKKVAELAEAIAKSGAQVTGSVRSTPLQRDRTPDFELWNLAPGVRKPGLEGIILHL
jgi:hypothetical protein